MDWTYANHKLATKGPKACSTCAKAKARCIPGSDGAKCERCYRLNKPCPSQAPAPPRRRKEPKRTKVAELERRLEDLTSRIEKAQAPSPPESQSQYDLTPRTTAGQVVLLDDDYAAPGARAQELGMRMTNLQAEAGRRGVCRFMEHIFPDEMDELLLQKRVEELPPTPIPLAKQQPLPSTVPACASVSWPMGQEADTLLAEYRTMEHLFPFVKVPQRMTSVHFMQQRPFLRKAILMAACQADGARQIYLGNALLKEIVEATMARPGKSLDLLQGLQILVAWFHYNLTSFQVTNLLYTARSMCVTLSLNDNTKHQGPTAEMLEQMRAFAGTYYLVTVISTTSKKPDVMLSSPQLDVCLETLAEEMEYSTDDLLVHLVRAQQLSQTISQTIHTHQAIPSLPLTILTSSLQSQLTNLISSLPAHLSENPILKGHHQIAMILIHEPSLSDNTNTCSITDPTSRLTHLWTVLTATKSAIRFSTPSGDNPRFICIASFDFICAFLTAIKLITIPPQQQPAGWDPTLIKAELDFDNVLYQQITDLEILADKRNGREEDPFRELAGKLRMLKECLDDGQVEMMMNEQLQKAARMGAMTVTDATEGIVEDLDRGLWEMLVLGAGMELTAGIW